MGFPDKIMAVKNECVRECLKLISTNWDTVAFWIYAEAPEEFSRVYTSEFKKEFGSYLTKDIEAKISLSCKNLIFAIAAIMRFRSYDLENILDYSELYIREQINDFHNWCEDENILEIID